jgi:DNA-binding transcriptional regulator YiaG
MKQDMEWKGKYKSEIMMVCHMDAKAMHEVGAISDKEMREFDEMCLVQEPEVSYAVQRTAAEISVKRLSSQEL